MLDPVGFGAEVIKVGWGCEERTNVDPESVHLGRYKAAGASVILASEIQFDNPLVSEDQVTAVDAGYLPRASPQ